MENMECKTWSGNCDKLGHRLADVGSPETLLLGLPNGSAERAEGAGGCNGPPEDAAIAGDDFSVSDTSTVGSNLQHNDKLSLKAKQTIQVILEQIESLSQMEQYYLYLKLPAEVSNVDPFRQPLNPLGSRSEINRTISWIRTHLEEDPDTSLPKQEVYDEYSQYCNSINIKSLSQADFGKVMKQVYPKVRARRLGTRGNSRYCYSGLRRCINLKTPLLPDLSDRPVASELPCTQANLTSASWLIIKDWAFQQLGIQFTSLHAMAYYLILNNLIGAGTEAAKKLTSVAESQLKGDETNGNSKSNKHRETQLQLQRKIQQKNEVKERKRKSDQAKQSSGAKTATKKQKMQSPTNNNCVLKLEMPPNNSSGGSITSTSSSSTTPTTALLSSNSTSPTQGSKPICDKSLDFTTQLPSLPDFNSFQKPASGAEEVAAAPATAYATTSPTNISQRLVPAPHLLCTGGGRKKHEDKQKTKYKTIQPRLQQPCDIATYNLPPADQNRSQEVHNLDRIKERKLCHNEEENRTIQATAVPGANEDECDVSDLPLSRERLNSIGNVDKDAMDEYLGTNNSQHEEEMSRYFPNPPTNGTTNSQSAPATKNSTTDDTKLSTLRQLLEQNMVDNQSIVLPALSEEVKPPQTTHFPGLPQNASLIQPFHTITPFPIGLAQVTSTSHQTHRRVSFETPDTAEPVPPSPNTRCKNFSFTPISPGPQSPGVQSKCSSTNASPFVSPRNTPVPRTKNTMHQNAGLSLAAKKVNVKKESELKLEIPDLVNTFPKNYITASAPASPMLQQLLNNHKAAYKPSYTTTEPSSNLQRQFFSNQQSFRSQSVPLHQMLKTALSVPLLSSSEDILEPIVETEMDVKQILNQLTQPCDNNLNQIEISQFEGQFDNNNLEAAFVQQELFNNTAPRNINRSQSIEVDLTDKTSHFRSVPNTPLPARRDIKLSFEEPPQARSYPSTPMNHEVGTSNFTFPLNSDYLLNGQPIRAPELELFGNFVSDNGVEKSFQIEGDEFDNFDNGNQLMDENGVLIEQNYGGSIQ